MYKVDYYTYAKMKDGSAGNIIQFNNTFYTEHEIKVIPQELQRTVNAIYGHDKYITIIEKIESIKGHGER